MFFADIVEWLIQTPEPMYWLRDLEIALEGFGAYFLGAVIRRVVMTSEESPPLSHQMLLAIPISLVVVPPLLYASTSATELSQILVSLGVIMEHGMILNDTAAKHLRTLSGSSGQTFRLGTWPNARG